MRAPRGCGAGMAPGGAGRGVSRAEPSAGSRWRRREGLQRPSARHSTLFPLTLTRTLTRTLKLSDVAQIVETRSSPAPAFYVHYVNCDKRLDEWVPAARVAPLPTGGGRVAAPARLAAAPSLTASDPAAAAALEAADSLKMTRRLKRRIEVAHHVPTPLEELPPADAAAERAHQERTRLKNIRAVELGKHDMDAWYYSPYPDPFGGLDRCGGEGQRRAARARAPARFARPPRSPLPPRQPARVRVLPQVLRQAVDPAPPRVALRPPPPPRRRDLSVAAPGPPGPGRRPARGRGGVAHGGRV